MGKIYSKKEMEEILKKDVKIPDKIEERIQDTYQQIGAGEIVRIRNKKKHNVWKIVAAVAVLTVGSSVVVVAANMFLSANRVKNEDRMEYEITIDREKEAHAIEVQPTYMPEGFEYQTEGAYGGKWRNEETENNISIITYNAAELDRRARLGDDPGFQDYTKLDEVTIGDQKVDVYTGDKVYTDSEDIAKQLFLFNEEHGYEILLSTSGTIGADELVKIAEGLEVTILDEVVPYATEAEIEQELAVIESMMAKDKEMMNKVISADAVKSFGEEITNPFIGSERYRPDDIRYTVKSAEIRDSISWEEFPAEYVMQYDRLASWLNADGTMKPHDRISYERSSDETGEPKSVNTKFLVVELNMRNASDEQCDVMTPMVTSLIRNEDGTYKEPTVTYGSANKDYGLQYGGYNGNTFAMYFDKLYYTEGTKRWTSGHHLPMEAGESLDCTVIYIVDEDMIDNTCLCFYDEYGNASTEISIPYVAIGKNVKK